MAGAKDFIIIENDDWEEAGNKIKIWWTAGNDKIVNGYTFHPTYNGIDIINLDAEFSYVYIFPKHDGIIDYTFVAQQLYGILVTEDQHQASDSTIADLFGIGEPQNRFFDFLGKSYGTYQNFNWNEIGIDLVTWFFAGQPSLSGSYTFTPTSTGINVHQPQLQFNYDYVPSSGYDAAQIAQELYSEVKYYQENRFDPSYGGRIVDGKCVASPCPAGFDSPTPQPPYHYDPNDSNPTPTPTDDNNLPIPVPTPSPGRSPDIEYVVSDQQTNYKSIYTYNKINKFYAQSTENIQECETSEENPKVYLYDTVLNQYKSDYNTPYSCYNKFCPGISTPTEPPSTYNKSIIETVKGFQNIFNFNYPKRYCHIDYLDRSDCPMDTTSAIVVHVKISSQDKPEDDNYDYTIIDNLNDKIRIFIPPGCSRINIKHTPDPVLIDNIGYVASYIYPPSDNRTYESITDVNSLSEDSSITWSWCQPQIVNNINNYVNTDIYIKSNNGTDIEILNNTEYELSETTAGWLFLRKLGFGTDATSAIFFDFEVDYYFDDGVEDFLYWYSGVTWSSSGEPISFNPDDAGVHSDAVVGGDLKPPTPLRPDLDDILSDGIPSDAKFLSLNILEKYYPKYKISLPTEKNNEELEYTWLSSTDFKSGTPNTIDIISNDFISSDHNNYISLHSYNILKEYTPDEVSPNAVPYNNEDLTNEYLDTFFNDHGYSYISSRGSSVVEAFKGFHKTMNFNEKKILCNDETCDMPTCKNKFITDKDQTITLAHITSDKIKSAGKITLLMDEPGVEPKELKNFRLFIPPGTITLKLNFKINTSVKDKIAYVFRYVEKLEDKDEYDFIESIDDVTNNADVRWKLENKEDDKYFFNDMRDHDVHLKVEEDTNIFIFPTKENEKIEILKETAGWLYIKKLHFGQTPDTTIFEEFKAELQFAEPNGLTNYIDWLKETSWASNGSPIQWSSLADEMETSLIPISDGANYHRIPWETIDFLFSKTINKLKNSSWKNFLIQHNLPYYKVSMTNVEYKITKKDLDNRYFVIPNIAAPPYLFYCAGVVNIGLDKTDYPLCFGFSETTEDCSDTCEYKQQCKQFSNYLCPSNCDFYYGSKFWIREEELQTIEIGSRIRLQLAVIDSDVSPVLNPPAIDGLGGGYNIPREDPVPSAGGTPISYTGYPTVYELWGIITRLNTENLNDFDLAYNFRDGFNPNNEIIGTGDTVSLGFNILADIGDNPAYIERMRSTHDTDSLCFYIPPKVKYICCTIYAPRDPEQGLVCRFKQPPEGLYINNSYSDINWVPYTQVHFPDDYYEDVYVSTLGGHAEAVNTASSATGFTESGWFFMKLTGGFIMEGVQLTMTMDRDDYVEWYDSCQWDEDGNPMMITPGG